MSEIIFDKEYIKAKLQEVLKVAHTDSRKWKIKEHSDRLQYSCPVCGDSESAPGRKMRGTLYWKNLMHICFNETKCNCSFITLLKKFNVEIDLQQKVNIYNYVDSNITYKKDDDNFVIDNLDKLIDIDFLSEYLNTHSETQFSNFEPVKKNSAVYQYLKYDRLITNFENIYQAVFHITAKWKENVIVILNKSGKKVLGFQLRNLKYGDKRFFKIYNFEKIYNIIHQNDTLDELEAIGYNKISNFYNILNVNWDKPVTIFEGYLDAQFYHNSIGAIGINSIDEMSFLMNDNLDLQFFFDQDNIGVSKALDMLEKGHKVFLWQKLNKDLIANKKDKYQAEQYCLKIKDLNKLVQEMKNPDAVNKLKLQNYFSNSIFDKLYLNSSLYKKN